MKKLYLLLAILVQVSVVFSQHFVKGYTSLNPYDPMNIVIKSAKIDGVSLEIDDEIAVFDGNLCCGVWVVDKLIEIPLPSVYASTEYPIGSQNGMKSGNTMYFRFWDNSAGKEYHNVIATVLDDKDVEIPNVFASNGTAFVQLTNSNTTKTWTDNSLPIWSDPDAWDPIGVPEPIHDVIIPSGTTVPSISASVNAYCGTLTLDNNLSILSTASGTGSLLVTADISGAGNVTSKRYMIGNAWHLVSSPLSGQTISDFLSSSANNTIPTKPITNLRGFTDYSESGDKWNDYFINSTAGSIEPGKGYLTRSSANTAITFSGSVSNGNISIAISKSSNGWNLIGNPYASALYINQEVNGFLTVNSGMIDDNYEACYVWDQTANSGSGAYAPITGNEGQSNLATGQGFFVKAASAGNISFTKSMQVHQTDAPFKSSVIPSPNVVFTAMAGGIYSSTKINFNEKMTLGLDPSYDAGILKSGNGFDIYSRLVTDNGINFAIQALPGFANDNYIIPIGVDALKGGEVVFSAQSLNLPVSYDLIIEDKLTNSQTNIKNGGLYVANVADGAKGIGRFYLHVGASVLTGLDDIHKDEVVVYTMDQTLFIKGSVSNNAQIMVYSVDGRLVKRFAATSPNLNKMSVAGFSPGVYILNIQDVNGYKPVKFVVE